METIKLSEIPLPQLSDGTMAVKNEPETIDEVLKKCEDLGWMWMIGLFPTHHPKNLIFDWLGFGHTNPPNRKDRLYSSPNSEAWSRLYTVIIDQNTTITKQAITNLKISNTRADATHCASCHGLLKDPGMGPTYKHCPKCEP